MRTDPQLAEIIIKKMREIAEVDSQVGLAKILGVKSPTISGSIKAGRIPDRWFDVFESKFKKTKDDICAGLDSCFPFGGIDLSDLDGRTKRGLPIERHREIGVTLYTMYHQAQSLVSEFLGAYPNTGKLARATIALHQIEAAINDARHYAEENLFIDHRDTANFEYYYPAKLITQEMHHAHLAKIAKVEAELTELVTKKEEEKAWVEKRDSAANA